MFFLNLMSFSSILRVIEDCFDVQWFFGFLDRDVRVECEFFSVDAWSVSPVEFVVVFHESSTIVRQNSFFSTQGRLVVVAAVVVDIVAVGIVVVDIVVVVDTVVAVVVAGTFGILAEEKGISQLVGVGTPGCLR
jgi:hypothetical protein